ncbi:toxin-activating lysine-acyltransferase [Mangrovicoccus sp. HB161399]|uniref:toxin-activating lysine-acyltransferase n=1 Tax=Mangrovicoccus sp. HB161399 TaxID=2720392 RepID=UPI001556E994|nr:toxin-activating lysine-acyltransferase [Mangrovicoccus sp. HB161399]
MDDTARQDGAPGAAAGLDPEVARQISGLRAALRENFGKVVMAMMMQPRYRAQMLGDLQHLVLDPMLQDRIAVAYAGAEPAPGQDMAGFAIWASVSEEVDASIREQIASGVFPVRLKPADWTSGRINWLLDIVAPDQATAATVIANFRKVAKEGELKLHPLITRLVDPATLEKMGARRAPAPEAAAG